MYSLLIVNREILIARLVKIVPLSHVYPVGTLTLVHLHLVAVHVIQIFTMITMELLHLTARHAIEIAQLALAQRIQIEQAA